LGEAQGNQLKRFAHEVRGEASIAFHAMEKRFNAARPKFGGTRSLQRIAHSRLRAARS
jgi:hypothetical protein